MADAAIATDGPVPLPSGEPGTALPPIPSPLGGRVLLFASLALIDYWLTPLLIGLTNYAGSWSTVGQLLFVGWAVALAVFVFLPLGRRLLGHSWRLPGRLLFVLVSVGGFLAGLGLTGALQRSGTAADPSLLTLAWTTAYTPFGAWSTLVFGIPSLGVSAALNPVDVLVLASLAVLSASMLVLAPPAAAAACSTATSRTAGWRGRAAGLLVWTPFGFLTSCSACTPVYLSLLGVAAPEAASAGYSFLPFAPWGAFAGLVYVASFAVALTLLRRITVLAADPEVPEERRVAGA